MQEPQKPTGEDRYYGILVFTEDLLPLKMALSTLEQIVTSVLALPSYYTLIKACLPVSPKKLFHVAELQNILQTRGFPEYCNSRTQKANLRLIEVCVVIHLLDLLTFSDVKTVLRLFDFICYQFGSLRLPVTDK